MRKQTYKHIWLYKNKPNIIILGEQFHSNPSSTVMASFRISWRPSNASHNLYKRKSKLWNKRMIRYIEGKSKNVPQSKENNVVDTSNEK